MRGKDGGAAKLAELRRAIVDLRVPASGSIDLSARCNLRCVHCYHGRGGAGRGGKELGTQEWLAVLDQVAAAGCLALLITGGEPLLRRDFPVLYRRAKELGMLVTVFTNGTLVSPEVIELFADLPPQMVEITLYGASASVYESVTGVPGSHRRCLDGVAALLEGGVNVGLKTVLLTLNVHELGQMRTMARERGVGFRLDPAVFPGLDGDRRPLDYRVPPAEVAQREREDPRRRQLLRETFERFGNLRTGNRLYSCGAGRTGFHIDAAGRLLPCIIMKEPSWDLRRGSFLEGWTTVMNRLADLRAGDGYRCGSCDKLALCGCCPAFSELEKGSAQEPSSYLCAVGEERLRALKAENSDTRKKKR